MSAEYKRLKAEVNGDHVCATCYWSERDDFGELVCVSSDSTHRADWVEEDDSCEEWEQITNNRYRSWKRKHQKSNG